MVFGGNSITSADVSNGPNCLSLDGLDVEKKTAKVPPLMQEVSTFWKLVKIAYFSDGNRLVMLFTTGKPLKTVTVRSHKVM